MRRRKCFLLAFILSIFRVRFWGACLCAERAAGSYRSAPFARNLVREEGTVWKVLLLRFGTSPPFFLQFIFFKKKHDKVCNSHQRHMCFVFLGLKIRQAQKSRVYAISKKTCFSFPLLFLLSVQTQGTYRRQRGKLEGRKG